MLKKIEAFLKRVFAEVTEQLHSDVGVIRLDLNKFNARVVADRDELEAKFGADIKRFESTFEQELSALENRVTERLEEVVTDALTRFDQKAQLIEQTIAKELDHWKADEEVRKADHALIHPKPTRR